MKKVLKNNDKTVKYIEKLPKIYVIGYWKKYDIIDFPLACWKKINDETIPYIYEYNEDTNTYELTRILDATTGVILFWTTRKELVEYIVSDLNVREQEDNKVLEVFKRLIAEETNYINTEYANRFKLAIDGNISYTSDSEKELVINWVNNIRNKKEGE